MKGVVADQFTRQHAHLFNTDAGVVVAHGIFGYSYPCHQAMAVNPNQCQIADLWRNTPFGWNVDIVSALVQQHDLAEYPLPSR
jgi:hypothetical protein